MKNEKKNQLCSAIRNADCVVIGAGAGFSTSVGYRPKDEILNELKLYKNQG